ncbi:hypothetical protein ACVDFE_03270 [Lentzea chajnantorensis]
MFGLIASGAVCTKDDYGCLGTAVMTVPVFTVVASVLGWLALRAVKLARPWLAVPAVVMAVATTVFFALGFFWAAVPIFAVFFALAAVLTTPPRS